MTPEPGRDLAHYRIGRLIGQGGMGKVFLAEDTKLHRKVAIKVLPPEMASDADRLSRFQREARAVAALNHPHIVTIHSVEEADGTHFLTMELVEGTSLDQLLPPEGLPLTKVFDIGIALGDALAAAHEKGVIHRDLKPANVMITKDGRVKVLDFGLAKLAQGSPEEELASRTAFFDPSLTTTGVVVGTVPYMSPEQVGGEAVDARTDIFSLGVVLYEMATGRRPFGGSNKAETISSIVRDAPRPITEVRQDAPRHLGRIIEHCLQKDPRDRFQTARDVFNELRVLRNEVSTGQLEESGGKALATSSTRVAGGRKGLWIGLGILGVLAVTGLFLFQERGQDPRQSPASAVYDESQAAAPDAKSIAVLPFADMSQNKDQEYFSDGISEELLNLLSKIRDLKVAARTSSFSFKGKGVEIPEIARQLHVAHVLEGSVRKSGDRVRITAQLIHAADGFQLWSQTYDRELDDIFRIQDEIAADVVKELKVTLLGMAPKVRTTDPKAYALYLQARQLAGQGTAEAFEKSDTLYSQVLEIDPSYTPAWFELSRNIINKAITFGSGQQSSSEVQLRAHEAAEKALEIDPDYAPAHCVLGWIAMTSGNDLARAARHFERALELDPTNLVVMQTVSTFLYDLGRLNEGLALQEAVARRDPVNATAFFNLGVKQNYPGRFDQAIASFRTALSLAPGYGIAHYQIGVALLLKGDASGALTEIEQETSELARMRGLPMAYHALGRKADSDAAITALIAKDEHYSIACIYAFRGETDQAFAWLDKAVEYGEGALHEVVLEVLLANIHSDPRWLPFLRRIGRAPEQLAKIGFKVTLPEDASE